jgi:predicted kinase
MTNAARQSYGSAAYGSVILLDGAFGVGKSTVARRFRDRVTGSRLYDPERLGYVMRRLPRWFPGSTARLADYRDSRLWRALTARAIRVFARAARPLIVPMALNRELLDVLRRALAANGCLVVHVCLVAPERVVHERLAARGVSRASTEGQWVYPRASAACREHSRNDALVHRIDTDRKAPDAIVDELIALVEGAVA